MSDAIEIPVGSTFYVKALYLKGENYKLRNRETGRYLMVLCLRDHYLVMGGVSDADVMAVRVTNKEKVVKTYCNTYTVYFDQLDTFDGMTWVHEREELDDGAIA